MTIGERWFLWWFKTTPRAVAYGIIFGLIGYSHFLWWAERRGLSLSEPGG